MILVIDNYDSFVHNLARYFRQLGTETKVCRNDEITVDEIKKMNPCAIVISPGPCTPTEAGCSVDVVRELGDSIPILGVCLGHQAIVQAYGGEIVRADEPMHGRSSRIEHQATGIFQSIPSPLTVGRYHSLVACPKSLPECLEVTASTDDTIMAIQHREHSVLGVQFHPESVLTEQGYRMIANFLSLAGIGSNEESAAENLTLPKDAPAILGRTK